MITRIGYNPVTKLGLQVGPMPLFLTDIVLLLLVATTILHKPVNFITWATAGAGADTVGTLVWLLLLLAVSYFAFAFSEFKIFAVRDLAIFSYSIFFPITYFNLQTRADAIAATRAFVYSGVILCLLLLFQSATGIDTGLFTSGMRLAFGKQVLFIGDDDVGAIAAFSVVGLLPYLLFDKRRRLLNVACIVCCAIALAVTTTRSATLGAALALGLTFLVAGPRYKIATLCFVGVFVLIMLLAEAHPDVVPMAGLFKNFADSLASGSSGRADPTALFRILRWQSASSVWKEHPLFGIGFGAPIVSSDLIIPGETLGLFNIGMPHNTYLFLLARTGLVGFSLVVFGWTLNIIRLAWRAWQTNGPDELAVANVLIAMAGFGGFVLFFERPMYNAPYWIMAAVAARLWHADVGAEEHRLEPNGSTFEDDLDAEMEAASILPGEQSSKEMLRPAGVTDA